MYSLNEDRMSRSNLFYKGEACNMGYGDIVQIIGFYKEDNLALLEVRRRSLDKFNLSLFTANCPPWTLFFSSH